MSVSVWRVILCLFVNIGACFLMTSVVMAGPSGLSADAIYNVVVTFFNLTLAMVINSAWKVVGTQPREVGNYYFIKNLANCLMVSTCIVFAPWFVASVTNWVYPAHAPPADCHRCTTICASMANDFYFKAVQDHKQLLSYPLPGWSLLYGFCTALGAVDAWTGFNRLGLFCFKNIGRIFAENLALNDPARLVLLQETRQDVAPPVRFLILETPRPVPENKFCIFQWCLKKWHEYKQNREHERVQQLQEQWQLDEDRRDWEDLCEERIARLYAHRQQQQSARGRSPGRRV
jgi:hypothetical protein